MKKIFLIVSLSLCVTSMYAQQILDLRSGKILSSKQSTVPTRTIEEQKDGYRVTYTFDYAAIQKDNLFSGTVFWRMDGFGMNQNQGEPCTLLHNDWFMIPAGCSAEVSLVDCKYNDYNYELTPARIPLLNNNNEAYTKQNVHPIRLYEGYMPSSIVTMSGVYTYRGHGICQTTLAPIQYNYLDKKVRAYTSLTYKITFVPDQTDVIRTASKGISREDNFLGNNVIGGSWQSMRNVLMENGVRSDVLDYLILSTSTYAEAVERFAAWKRLLGFNVHVIIRDNWTSASVKNTVEDVYANTPSLYYLLIVGDHNDIPACQSTTIRQHVTDLPYGCINDNYIPDIYCGRLSVSTIGEANTVVDKIINYEQTPPTNISFYNKGVHCAYFQDKDHDGYADRRFAQTSEDIRSYVMSQGKNVQRIYKTEPDVFPTHWNRTQYSYGEPIPNELQKPTFAWNGNSTNITNSINNGAFYVLHRDHGYVGGWGDPSYTQSNISSLTNGSLLPVVFSLNCQTGKFDQNCFAETFLRKSNGGCVGIYAATEISYSGYNDALATGMFDAIWPSPGLCVRIRNRNSSFSPTPEPTYTLGQIMTQGMMRLSETYGIDGQYTVYTRELFHCLGDPSMKIYTECPSEYSNVSVIRNSNSIRVKLANGDYGRITIYDPIVDEVQSFIGNDVTINTTNSSEAVVCVSGHNRIPFIQRPDVMYIQNTNISGGLTEVHDVIKVGNHVTSEINPGDVTTSNANILLKARKVVLDRGTYISTGTTLKIENP